MLTHLDYLYHLITLTYSMTLQLIHLQFKLINKVLNLTCPQLNLKYHPCLILSIKAPPVRDVTSSNYHFIIFDLINTLHHSFKTFLLHYASSSHPYLTIMYHDDHYYLLPVLLSRSS